MLELKKKALFNLIDFQAISKHEAANHDIQFNISVKESSDKHQSLLIKEVSPSFNISTRTPVRKNLPASGQFSSLQHRQNKQYLMNDFLNPVGKNIANVLSSEEPFPQISSPDYRNVSVAFKNIHRSFLSPESGSTSVLKKRTNKSTQV